jgi:DNA-binding CsgD family transcriptional regulator
MVRLIGDVVAHGGGHADKKRRLLEGLCKLIHADCWVWGLSCQREPGKPQVYVSFLNGGFTEDNFVKLLKAIEHPEMIAITNNYFSELKRENTHLTRSRYQITTPEQMQASGALEAWKEANIGATILSLRPLDDLASSAIGLYRHYDKPEFTPRESRIAHIVLAEIPWLHEQGWPDDRGVQVPSLSKRQRLTLNLLTLGHSQKQMAQQMGISMHTVRDYIKDVYRYFDVHSQAELMSRFYQGNGKDVVKAA